MRRLSVLMSAYACEPGKGSEPEVGWQWAMNVAQLHDLTVVTRANNQASIEAGLKARNGTRPQFVYYDLPKSLLRWKGHGLPVWLYYLLWQIGARLRLRKELRRFDLIHHVTFNSFRQPGFWWFCNRPVVLGPLGGGQICPWKFFSLMRGRRVQEFFRTCSVLASPALPHLWVSFAAASKILVVNADTERRMPGLFRRKTQRILETGIARERIGEERQARAGQPLRILWLGWLLPIKAPELALRAFARACQSHPDLRLTMGGNGPLADSLQRLASYLAVEDRVDWKGRVPRAEVFSLMLQHDLFLFTSLRDTSGNVLLEAMAAGLPAVTLFHQGVAEIASSETAICVRPLNVGQTIHELSAAILKLRDSPELRAAMGRAARARILDLFEWQRQAQRMDAIYQAASGR